MQCSQGQERLRLKRPHQPDRDRGPGRIGDDVLVRLAGHEADGKALVLIKELVRRTSGLVELRQFNPDVVFTIDAAKIHAVHKIVGEAI